MNEPTFQVIGNEGPTVVCIGALGQGPLIWQKLWRYFESKCRIISWNLRGTQGDVKDQFRVNDHVADLESVVRREGLRSCRVITWCSGAKVGIEAVLRHPAVCESLVLCNGTYTRMRHLESLETPFERTLLELCEALGSRPGLANTMKGAMLSLLEGPKMGDRESETSRELRNMIREPFITKETALNYARQVVDYMTHDVSSAIGEVKVPVLVVSGNRDCISSPRMAEVVAGRFARGGFVEVPEANHYALYEMGTPLFKTIERFWDDPEPFLHRAKVSHFAGDRA